MYIDINFVLLGCDTVATETGCVSCDATYLSWYEGRAWMIDTTVEGAEATCLCKIDKLILHFQLMIQLYCMCIIIQYNIFFYVLACPTNCLVCSEFNTCTTCYPHLYFNLETKVCACKISHRPHSSSYRMYIDMVKVNLTKRCAFIFSMHY